MPKIEFLDLKMCNISESFKVIKRNCDNGSQHSILHASVTYISHKHYASANVYL